MEEPLDEKDLEKKLKKEQKAKVEEDKKLKAKQKEAARLQVQAASDGAKKSEKKQKKKGATDENPEDFIDPGTPTGQKKLLASQMAKQYSPSAVEKSWYTWWESSQYFVADAASSKPPFVIVLLLTPDFGTMQNAVKVASDEKVFYARRFRVPV